MKKIFACVMRTRDEKGDLHMTMLHPDYARALVKGSSVVRQRRGMSGERFLQLANGVVIVADLVTQKQFNEWKDF